MDRTTYLKQYREKNRERIRAVNREYRVSNRIKIREAARKHDRKNRLKEYGLSITGFELLWESQGKVCASCGLPASKPCVDHDHKTGKVRGVLCNNCNAALGFLKESVVAAQGLIRYIRRHNQPKVT